MGPSKSNTQCKSFEITVGYLGLCLINKFESVDQTIKQSYDNFETKIKNIILEIVENLYFYFHEFCTGLYKERVLNSAEQIFLNQLISCKNLDKLAHTLWVKEDFISRIDNKSRIIRCGLEYSENFLYFEDVKLILEDDPRFSNKVFDVHLSLLHDDFVHAESYDLDIRDYGFYGYLRDKYNLSHMDSDLITHVYRLPNFDLAMHLYDKETQKHYSYEMKSIKIDSIYDSFKNFLNYLLKSRIVEDLIQNS